MFKTFAAIAGLMMMLAPAGAQYLGNHAVNPYAPHSAAPDSITNSYSRPSAASPYTPPKLYGSPGGDKRQLSINPYDPDTINSLYGRYDNPYAPDRVRNPYGAGNPYKPLLSPDTQDAH